MRLSDRRRNLAPLALTLIACAMVADAHASFMWPEALPLHGHDEGYINALASRLWADGGLPYVNAVGHRGPLLYALAAWAVRLGPRFSWMPLRCLSLGATLCTVGGTYAIGALAHRALGGAVAAAFVVLALLVHFEPYDGMAFNGELAALAFALPGCALVMAGQRGEPSRKRLALIAAGGALLSAGMLCKQVAAVLLVSVALHAAWPERTAPRGPRLARKLAALVGGAALPVLVLVAVYGAAGHLAELAYWVFVYNSKVYMAPYTPELRATSWQGFMILNGVTLVVSAVTATAACAQAFALVRQPERAHELSEAQRETAGARAFVAVSLLLSGLAARAPLRDFGHYYVLVLPWLGLLGGVLLEDAMTLLHDADRRGLDTAVAIAATALMVPICNMRERQQRDEVRVEWHRSVRERTSQRVCSNVDILSTSADRVVIWGFAPEFYTYCRRVPGTRYPMTTFVAGFVPWFEGATPEQDDARAVPGARRAFLDDLEAMQPKVLIDAPGTMGGRSIRRYPELAAYLDEKYCFRIRVEDIDLYQRLPPGWPCIKSGGP
jgi:hypothetical protein